MRLKRFKSRSPRGRRRLRLLADRGRTGVDRKTLAAARKIVRQVRKKGDRGLLDLARRLDGLEAESVRDLRLDGGEPVAPEALTPGFAEALEGAIESVEAYHRAQAEHAGLAEGFRLERNGVVLEERAQPLQRVGLYVPGGRFPYPSTVVMSVIPARLAGVSEIVVTTPGRSFAASAELRYTLERLEVDEVWGIGGAQAIAALAYGTESVRPVQLVAGPGNVWVAAAKQLVAGDVGVDREAGPSEVVIVAGGDAPPELVAADLLAQAEHDPNAMAVLVTPDRKLVRQVAAEVEEQLPSLATSDVAGAALEARGAAFLVADFDEALALAEELAPEHLQLIGDGAEELAPRVRSAGAVFVGAASPVVFGDYLAGPSHVLPTAGTARFASGLGVQDFVRRAHTVRFSAEAAAVKAHAASVLAEVEGLMAHAAAARRRGVSPGSPEGEGS